VYIAIVWYNVECMNEHGIMSIMDLALRLLLHIVIIILTNGLVSLSRPCLLVELDIVEMNTTLTGILIVPVNIHFKIK